MAKTNPNSLSDQYWEPNHYDSLERFSSYYFQIKLINQQNPNTVLNIGSGSGFLRKYFLGERIKYHELDIDARFKPEFVADISQKVDLGQKFDVVCAFQVLEHIPFSSFPRALENIHLHSLSTVIISLPYRTVNFFFSLNFPFLKMDFKKSFERTFETRVSEKTHRWEMGLRGTSKSRVEEEIKKWFVIKKEFMNPQHPYHYFYLLQKK